MDILIWARDHWNIKFSTFTCTSAAIGGHLDILIWLIENGCECNNDTFECAIKNGHINILIWAHQKDLFPINNMCQIAINNGKLNVIKWLHTIKIKFDQDMYICIAKSKH